MLTAEVFTERPPLAKELFHPERPLFVEAAFDWIECAGLIGEKRASVSAGTGVEIALERFVEYGAERAPEAIRGLLAMRYYLVRIIGRCAQGGRGRTGM